MAGTAEVLELVREALPGVSKEVRLVAGEGVAVTYDPERPGDAVGSSESAGDDEPGRWWVSYVRLLPTGVEEDEDGPPLPAGELFEVEVAYQQEHEDAYDAGKEAGELMALLPKPPWELGASRNLEEAASDGVALRAWKKEKLDSMRKRARDDVLEELREEAKALASGRTSYPPEESILYEILKETGAL